MAKKPGIVDVTANGTTADRLRQVLHDTAARMDGAEDKDFVALAKQYCATARQLDELGEEGEDDVIDSISSRPDRKPVSNKARGAELHRKRSG